MPTSLRLLAALAVFPIFSSHASVNLFVTFEETLEGVTADMTLSLQGNWYPGFTSAGSGTISLTEYRYNHTENMSGIDPVSGRIVNVSGDIDQYLRETDLVVSRFFGFDSIVESGTPVGGDSFGATWSSVDVAGSESIDFYLVLPGGTSIGEDHNFASQALFSGASFLSMGFDSFVNEGSTFTDRLIVSTQLGESIVTYRFITPVPEPGTWVLSLGCLVFVAAGFLRRQAAKHRGS